MIWRTLCLSLCLLCASMIAAAQCPKLVISGPDEILEGDRLVFTLELNGDQSAKPTYNWMISAGTIKSGQGTSSITVDSAGLGGASVTATVEVGGYPNGCVLNASYTADIQKRPEARKLDEYGALALADEQARLDNYVIELQNDPLTKAYVIVYSGPKSAPAAAATRLKVVQTHLVKTRGVDAGRIVAIDGGYREEPATELWIVPENATPPQAHSTIRPAAAKPKPGAAKKP